MTFYPTDRLALFIDGANLYSAAKGLGFDIDYRKLLDEFRKRGVLVRAPGCHLGFDMIGKDRIQHSDSLHKTACVRCKTTEPCAIRHFRAAEMPSTRFWNAPLLFAWLSGLTTGVFAVLIALILLRMA